MNPSCPICRRESRATAYGVARGCAMMRCAACGHIFMRDEYPHEAADRMYENYSYDVRGLDQVAPFIITRLEQVAASFAPYRRSGRLLDVGFGQGAMLAAAGNVGWKAEGIEKSTLAVRHARERGFTVTEGDFPTSSYESGSFDVLTMIEVIEHLPDPWPFFRQALRLLRPGGILFITTPNGSGLNSRIARSQWFPIAPPEHCNIFSVRSLRIALRQTGFSPRVFTEGINPYETVNAVRRITGRQITHVQDGGDNMRLNEQFTTDWKRAVIKRLVNGGLRATGLGDSLKAIAERPQ